MRSADRHMGRRLRWALIATAVCAWSAPVLAGGPLYVVPANGTMKPARWEGTVKVYTDRGDLGAVDHATANQLVANSLSRNGHPFRPRASAHRLRVSSAPTSPAPTPGRSSAPATAAGSM